MRRLTSLAVGLLLTVAGMSSCTPTDYSTCPERGSGQVRVAVVVDARALGGKADVVCVVVPSGSTGLDALRARATRLGTAMPRINAQNGLVCAIDGKPAAPACGQSGPNGPEYWSYWLGGSSWRYAPVGPGTRTESDQAVDGWRFLKGGTRTAPDGPSSFAALTN